MTDRARFDLVVQRLTECLATADVGGLLALQVEPHVSWHTQRLSISIAVPDIECHSTDYCHVWTARADPLVLRRVHADWPADERLCNAWSTLTDSEALMEWRLQALLRICELHDERRGVKSSLQRNQRDRIRQLRESMKKPHDDDTASSDVLKLLEEEEEQLTQRLSHTSYVDKTLRSQCEAMAGSPYTVARSGELARVYFMYRQQSCVREEIVVRFQTTKFVARCRSRPSIVAQLWQRVCRKTNKRPAWVSSPTYPLSLLKAAEDASIVQFDSRCTNGYILGRQDLFLLNEWMDLLYADTTTSNSAPFGWDTRKEKKVSAQNVLEWQRRANARYGAIHQAISDCKRELVHNRRLRFAARGSPDLTVNDTRVNDDGTEETKLVSLEELRKLEVKLVLQLSVACGLEHLYRTRCMYGMSGDLGHFQALATTSTSVSTSQVARTHFEGLRG